jgi:hypothetical protein
VGKGEEVVAAWVEAATQDPTPNLLITGHPIAMAALAATPAAARQAACALSSVYQLNLFFVSPSKKKAKSQILPWEISCHQPLLVLVHQWYVDDVTCRPLSATNVSLCDV